MREVDAIKELQSYAQHSWGGLNEAFEVAIDALEKQIPKKPYNLDSVPCNRCPACYDAVRVYTHGTKLHHCPWCGQALNWHGID